VKYTQLKQQERSQIYALLKAGHNQTEIARILNRHKSTIRREIQRNTGLRGYRPQQAQRFSHERKMSQARVRIEAHVWAYVSQLLRQD